MKKSILLVALLFVPASVMAYPAPDMTVGASPLQVIQQTIFEQNEMNDFRRFNDANDRPVLMRNDSAETMKEEYELKDKKQAPKIQLRSMSDQSQDVPDPKEMQLIEQNGHIMIKSIGH